MYVLVNKYFGIYSPDPSTPVISSSVPPETKGWGGLVGIPLAARANDCLSSLFSPTVGISVSQSSPPVLPPTVFTPYSQSAPAFRSDIFRCLPRQSVSVIRVSHHASPARVRSRSVAAATLVALVASPTRIGGHLAQLDATHHPTDSHAASSSPHGELCV